jgi:hypothetical protein
MKAWGVMLPPPLHGHNTCVWNRWVDVDEEVWAAMITMLLMALPLLMAVPLQVRRQNMWLPNPLSPAPVAEAPPEQAAPAAAKKK